MVRFDFMIREKAEPTLMEVNMGPNLKAKTEPQERFLERLLSNMVRLFGMSSSSSRRGLGPFLDPLRHEMHVQDGFECLLPCQEHEGLVVPTEATVQRMLKRRSSMAEGTGR